MPGTGSASWRMWAPPPDTTMAKVSAFSIKGDSRVRHTRHRAAGRPERRAPAREVNIAAASNAAGTYGDFGGRVLTQADPFAPPGHGRFEEHLAAMRSGEQQVLDGPYVEGIALRHCLFYGPGPAGDALVDGLRRRRLPVVSGGGVQPRGYIDDDAATVAALERGAAGSAYNVADDQPVSFSELVRAEVACGRALMAEWLRARHLRRSPLQLRGAAAVMIAAIDGLFLHALLDLAFPVADIDQIARSAGGR